MYRMFSDRIYSGDLKLDSKGRICMDDLEMQTEVQAEVTKLWNEANNDNVKDTTDIEGYRKEFFRLFGFEFEDVDYDADVDIEVSIEGID